MKRRRLFVGLIVVIILVAGAVVYGISSRREQATGAGTRLSPDAAVMATIPVQQRDIVHTITATGNVQPVRQVDLRFSRSGRVQDVLVSPGDRVEEGQLLVTLDNREQELAYFRARNAYEIALIDSAPNTVREREIDMELAHDALEQTYLRAPFAGVVTDIAVEPGQSVGSNDLVVQLVDDSGFEVRVAVDELDIARVHEGQPVSIRLDADPARVRDGVVEYVSMVANTSGNLVTVPVTVRFLEADEFLRPGYTATLQIIVAEARGVPVVPVEAIWEEGNVRTVTRVVDGERETVPVQTGLSDGVWVEIVSGVDVGDQVVALNYLGGPAAGGAFAGRTQGPGPGGAMRAVPMPGVGLPIGR